MSLAGINPRVDALTLLVPTAMSQFHTSRFVQPVTAPWETTLMVILLPLVAEMFTAPATLRVS